MKKSRASSLIGIHRQLRYEHLEHRRMLAAPDYAHSAADDFAADFVGGLPQNNPNGEWVYLGPDGTTGSLVVTNGNPSPPGPNTGFGAGWSGSTGIPSYTRGGLAGFPFPSGSIAGHGPHQIVWTAPPEVDLGGIEITGFLTQVDFEPTRQHQMRIYKNDFEEPFISIDADFVSQTAIVPLPTTRVAIEPGDTLTILLDGNGPLGNGVSTSAAFDVHIAEIDAQMDGDFSGNFVIDTQDLDIWQNNYGMAAAGQENGDADGDGDVDGRDFLIWQRQVGNSIDPGGVPPVYHPSTIIVETSGVTLPDGTQLDISGTQTHGLQEAFNFSAEQGWDMFVLPGIYNLSAHIDIEELQLRTFRFEDVTLNFDPSVVDFGIRFDSTMMVDWYWSGGAINAPGATHGVIWQPRTPHPLDGPKFGTIGVVDSRFQFNVDIAAGTHQVTMNTGQAAINDTTFYLKDISPNSIDFAGSNFSPTNIFSAPRTDDPIPFDLFNPVGRVTVNNPVGNFGDTGPDGIATVWKPDGTKLVTAGTSTSGLQEAFDYASANNLDVVVFGRGIRNVFPESNLGLYRLNETLVVPDLIGRNYKIYGVTFGTGQFISGPALLLGDMSSANFELTGQLAVDADVTLEIKPDDFGVRNSFIRVQTTVGMNIGNRTTVRIDPSLQTMEFNEFYFHEVNIGVFGVKIANPSSTTFFRDNFLRSVHTHGIGHVGVQLGESTSNADNITANNLQVRYATDGISAEAGLQVWGAFNAIDYVAQGSNLNFGAKFEPGSNDNTMLYGPIQASTDIADFGTNNTFVNSFVAAVFTNDPNGILATVIFSESASLAALLSPAQRLEANSASEPEIAIEVVLAMAWDELGRENRFGRPVAGVLDERLSCDNSNLFELLAKELTISHLGFEKSFQNL